MSKQNQIISWYPGVSICILADDYIFDFNNVLKQSQFYSAENLWNNSKYHTHHEWNSNSQSSFFSNYQLVTSHFKFDLIINKPWILWEKNVENKSRYAVSEIISTHCAAAEACSRS